MIIRLIVLALDKSLTLQSAERCNFAPVMRRHFAFPIAIILFCCFLLTSCEKKEKAIVLPPAGPAIPGNVTLGENYEKQVFYDFENNTVVATSEVASWDLAFEASADGSHVFMNGGTGVFLYNTHITEFAGIVDFPANFNSSLQFDDPSGNPDSTAVRDWRYANGQSKHEVFIVKLNDTSSYKFSLISVDSSKYMFEYGRMADITPKIVTLSKDELYNFSYFSFSRGIVTPDPPKASWDVVFTRYRYIYRYLNNFPYEINGVLLNPYKVTAAADSSRTFDVLTYDNTAQLEQTTNRDAIGFDWKTYNFATGHYDVNKNKCYVLHSRNGQVYKLHFLDFYSATGVKGTPSFESQQIQ